MKNKYLILALLCTTTILSCTSPKKQQATKKPTYTPITAQDIDKATIYEVNVRQYSPEGTFNAFAKDLPSLAALGVDVLWFMPIHPIGVKNRKGGLGSYYAIQDYRGINPEFGTMEDFKKMVQQIHELGMHIIIDWVPNHSAWDHAWIENHPEYYAKNDEGQMYYPEDWTDVVQLDYSNVEFRKAMTEEMKFWLTETDIDGFRCDVAWNVPPDYWAEAIPVLRAVKPIFMLAEAEKEELWEPGFEMQYAWEAHHILNDIAKGKKNVSAWDDHMKKIMPAIEQGYIYMNFTSNHDENSWAGTVYDRMGEGAETFAALTYMIPGMPLIYSGQEYDMNKRLKFFEKDEIPKTKGSFYPFYEKMNTLKDTRRALDGGKTPGSYERIRTGADESVLAFRRRKENDEVIFIANLTPDDHEVDLGFFNLDTIYTDAIRGGTFRDSPDHNMMPISPWEYMILVKK